MLAPIQIFEKKTDQAHGDYISDIFCHNIFPLTFFF